MAWARENGCPPGNHRQQVQWKAPVVTYVKVNWDVPVCSKTQKMGIGVVVWDHTGAFLAGLSLSIAFSSQPIIVESRACGER